MREIKFRAWDKELRHIVDWDDLKDTPLLQDGFDNLDCILMQYTGLKDKNGKEVYEDDIVKHKMPDEPYLKGEIIIGAIEYIEVVTAFRTVNNDGDEEPIHEDIIIEVIGNIHENLGLLT